MAIVYDKTPLKERVGKLLEDEQQHEAIMAAQDAIAGKRDALVAAEGADWETRRNVAARIRDHVLKNLDYYVKEFAENATKAGCTVHFAPTGADACETVVGIVEELGETECVKAKSMMTEEIGLNAALAEHGIGAVETDCAEHILSTADDMPSHIVVPAVHLDRRAIRDVYHEKYGYEGTDNPEEITRFLREVLRPVFLNARVGITGCNFGVASTGSTTLVTNEGNARMVTCTPATQIVVMGIERIVPDLASLDVMMSLLVPSAVGSKITSSFSLSTGPRRESEADGPATVHIVLVDNGRSRIVESEYRPILRCIRCGACMNTCPVYRHITGHGYGSIYPGPMGMVLTPLLAGYDEVGKLLNACTLCGACTSVCPVKIPLNSLIMHHRNDYVAEGHTSALEKGVFKLAEGFFGSRRLYGAGTAVAAPAMKLIGGKKGYLGKGLSWVPILKGWMNTRDLDLMKKKKFRAVFAEHERERANGAGTGEEGGVR